MQRLWENPHFRKQSRGGQTFAGLLCDLRCDLSVQKFVGTSPRG